MTMRRGHARRVWEGYVMLIAVGGLVVAVTAPAQVTNALGADSPLPITGPEPSDPPARPPVDPAVEAQLQQAQTLIQAGEWTQAETSLSDLYAAFPNDPDVRKMYSLLLIQNGDVDQALEMVKPVLGTVYTDFVVLNNAAWLYATHKNPEMRNSAKALELAQEALLLRPRNYHIWSTLAEAHYAGGQFEKALKASQEAEILAKQANAGGQETAEIAKQAGKIRKAVAALALME